jgi:DNA-binding transcriptional LysR family regulator
MIFEFRQLEYFIAVAEELHFGRAARKIHVTQPALSEQIRQLETALEVPLFVRTTRTVRLTGPGHVFLAQCRLILGQADACVNLTRMAGEGKLNRDYSD